MKKKTLESVWLTIALSLGIFAVALLIFVPTLIDEEPAPADTPQSGEVYYSGAENCGLLYLSEDGSGALLYLDFEAGTTVVNLFSDNAESRALSVGYRIDYTLRADDEFLYSFCDRLGGIELTENGILYRFSGASLRQKMENTNTLARMEEIAAGFFKKISKIGLSYDDFKFIIEGTETNLSFPASYSLKEVLPKTLANYIFENDF